MNIERIYADWQRKKAVLDAEWMTRKPSDWRAITAWIVDWSQAQRLLERERMKEIWG